MSLVKLTGLMLGVATIIPQFHDLVPGFPGELSHYVVL